MKAAIHPQYFDTKVVCACGNTFTIGSTVPEIRVELCNKCHPFYTGEQKFVDSASRIQKFQAKQQTAALHITKKKEKEERKNQEGPKTLREMLEAVK